MRRIGKEVIVEWIKKFDPLKAIHKTEKHKKRFCVVFVADPLEGSFFLFFLSSMKKKLFSRLPFASFFINI
jgi:hypothetical protein